MKSVFRLIIVLLIVIIFSACEEDKNPVEPAEKMPPVAKYSHSSTYIEVDSLLHLSADKSKDPDGMKEDLKVRWDYDGDGAWDTDYSYDKEIAVSFSSRGKRSVTLEVMDKDSLTDRYASEVYIVGEEDQGKPCPGNIEIIIEGRSFPTVLVGANCWMATNLDRGKAINGSDLPENDGYVEKYCYNDDYSNCSRYGGLYTWDEAMNYIKGGDLRGICPKGWHLPSREDFELLANTAGSGSALKAEGGEATNTTGFSALLSGDRTPFGFEEKGQKTYFWSSAEYYPGAAGRLGLDSATSGVSLNIADKEYGFSVRCVMD